MTVLSYAQIWLVRTLWKYLFNHQLYCWILLKLLLLKFFFTFSSVLFRFETKAT